MDVEDWKPPPWNSDSARPPPPRSKWRRIVLYGLIVAAAFLASLAFFARHELLAYIHRPASVIVKPAPTATQIQAKPSMTVEQAEAVQSSAHAAEEATDAAQTAAQAAASQSPQTTTPR